MKRALSWKTGLLAVALSAAGSAGLFCLALFTISVGMAPIGAHPLDVPFSMAGGLAALAACILLLRRYVGARKQRPSLLGVVHDGLLALLLFVPLFWLWGWCEALLSRIF